MNPQEAFLDVLIAAMKDAALNGKLTQVKSAIDPGDGKGVSIVRFVVVPEKMDWDFPKDQPLGTDSKKN